MKPTRHASITSVMPGSNSQRRGVEPRLLAEFASDAALDVDAPVADVARVRRAGGEIDRAGIGRMGPHLAEHEGAVGDGQAGHAEAVAHAGRRQADVAPVEEGAEAGLEIGAAEHAPAVGLDLDGTAMHQQHAAVEHPAACGAGPRPNARRSRRRGRRRSPRGGARRGTRRRRPPTISCGPADAPTVTGRCVPSATITAPPPIEADTSAPPSTSSPSTMRLGRPMATPWRICDRVIAVGRRVEPHHGAREGGGGRAGRGILGDAEARREHAGVEARRGRARIDIGRAGPSGQWLASGPGAVDGLGRGERHEREGHAGREHAAGRCRSKPISAASSASARRQVRVGQRRAAASRAGAAG